MPKAKKTIENLIDSAYENPDLIKHITEQVQKSGTGDKILSGESVLPSEADAMKWYRREILKQTGTEEEWKQKQRIQELEKQFSALTSALSSVPSKEFQAKLHEILTPAQEHK